jgi:hypothetical protein
MGLINVRKNIRKSKGSYMQTNRKRWLKPIAIAIPSLLTLTADACYYGTQTSVGSGFSATATVAVGLGWTSAQYFSASGIRITAQVASWGNLVAGGVQYQFGSTVVSGSNISTAGSWVCTTHKDGNSQVVNTGDTSQFALGQVVK